MVPYYRLLFYAFERNTAYHFTSYFLWWYLFILIFDMLALVYSYFIIACRNLEKMGPIFHLLKPSHWLAGYTFCIKRGLALELAAFGGLYKRMCRFWILGISAWVHGKVLWTSMPFLSPPHRQQRLDGYWAAMESLNHTWTGRWRKSSMDLETNEPNGETICGGIDDPRETHDATGLGEIMVHGNSRGCTRWRSWWVDDHISAYRWGRPSLHHFVKRRR